MFEPLSLLSMLSLTSVRASILVSQIAYRHGYAVARKAVLSKDEHFRLWPNSTWFLLHNEWPVNHYAFYAG